MYKLYKMSKKILTLFRTHVSVMQLLLSRPSYVPKYNIHYALPRFSTSTELRRKTSPNVNNFDTPPNSVELSKNEFNNIIDPLDPDTFGTLSSRNKPVVFDEGDEQEEKYLQNKPLHSQKLSTKQYADLIKDHVNNKRLKEAIDVLEVKMITEDKVKPENYIFNILIGACADVGYTKKAFGLFNDMKKRGLKVTGATYTSLFNACANSPWKEDGVSRATHLRQLMKDKGTEPNLTNYNAMIKAFGHCGDLKTSFAIVDEMVQKKIKIRVHTYNFLLQSCISNIEKGLKYAIIVWRKMLKGREKPNIYSFNLMLKCVKVCGLGSLSETREFISQITPLPIENNKYGNQLLMQAKNKPLLIASLPAEKLKETSNNSTVRTNSDDNTNLTITNKPQINLLSREPTLGDIISINEITTPQDKFILLGGLDRFLNEMSTYSVPPDIKTLSQLLPVIPDTIEDENKLLDLLKKHKVHADITFYNLLMKKRCFRKDYQAAKDVMKILKAESEFRRKRYYFNKKLRLKPDILTYGILAMACQTQPEAEELLKEIEKNKLRLNIEILGSLLRNGTTSLNFDYVLFITQKARSDDVVVNERFLSHLTQFNEKCERLLKKGPEDNPQCTPTFVTAYKTFVTKLNKWLSNVKTNKELEEEHPWTQFRENQPSTVQRPSVEKKSIRMYKKSRRNPPRYRVSF